MGPGRRSTHSKQPVATEGLEEVDGNLKRDEERISIVAFTWKRLLVTASRAPMLVNTCWDSSGLRSGWARRILFSMAPRYSAIACRLSRCSWQRVRTNEGAVFRTCSVSRNLVIKLARGSTLGRTDV